jgi:hypothetical protein
MTKVRQKHGIAGARKVTATNSDYYQSVTVTDEYEVVRLTLSANPYPADMTPHEARFISQYLSESANRVEASIKARVDREAAQKETK